MQTRKISARKILKDSEQKVSFSPVAFERQPPVLKDI